MLQYVYLKYGVAEMQNLVILDFGSNSTRLSINEVSDEGKYREVFRAKEMTRMAEGMGNSEKKVLQADAIERTLDAVRKFQKHYENLPNLKIKGIATAAVRVAENKEEFLEKIKSLTGVEVEILSGSAEAYYDYVGVANCLDVKDAVICDMGGGSFEVILMKNKKALNLISIQYGAVSLTEKFQTQDKINAGNLFEFEVFLRELFAKKLPWLSEAKELPLVLLGGANRTVARKKLGKLDEKDTTNIHNFRVYKEEFQRIYHKWLDMDKTERATDLGDESSRADIIIGGLTPVMQLMLQCESPYVMFSESGVREGIIFELLAEK